MVYHVNRINKLNLPFVRKNKIKKNEKYSQFSVYNKKTNTSVLRKQLINTNRQIII